MFIHILYFIDLKNCILCLCILLIHLKSLFKKIFEKSLIFILFIPQNLYVPCCTVHTKQKKGEETPSFFSCKKNSWKGKLRTLKMFFCFMIAFQSRIANLQTCFELIGSPQCKAIQWKANKSPNI